MVKEFYDIFEMFNLVQKQRILSFYYGVMAQNVLVDLVNYLENKLKENGESASFIKKIYSIFIEMAQNISHYSGEQIFLEGYAKNVGAGLIVIMEENDGYKVASGNYVPNTKLEALIEYCQNLNKLSTEQLKEHIKEKLKMAMQEGKTGGGIGLAEIIKKSGNQIVHDIIERQNEQSFVLLTAFINKEEINE